jgi:hypothetical protein
MDGFFIGSDVTYETNILFCFCVNPLAFLFKIGIISVIVNRDHKKTEKNQLDRVERG